jgi:hypothetical protein
MKKIYILLLFATLLSALSCKKPQDITVDIGIGIKVVNQQGQNLLSSPLNLNMENIEVYYVENGVEKLFYDKDLGTPKAFRIGGLLGSEEIFLFPNTVVEDFPVTLIKFGSLGTDTIKCQYKRTEGDLICTKVWLNGQLRYTYPGERVITTIK